MSFQSNRKLSTDATPVEDEEISTHQEAVPVPYLAGTRHVAGRWLGAAVNMVTTQAEDGGSKKASGGKGGGKGGGGAAENYNYYGTIFAAICYGPVAALFALIVDGKTVYENPAGLAASDDVTDITGSIDPIYFSTGGYLKIYWGTDTQTADAAAVEAGHPNYRRVAHIVGKNVLFGRERSTAPNLEFIVSRAPVADETLCPEAYGGLDDGQANPVAVMAEIFTSQNGLGWDLARLDAVSWATAASYCYTHRATCFCSPLFTSHGALREALGQMLAMFDGALAWTATGTLAIRLLKYGVNPGGLDTLDASYFTDVPRLKGGGWGDVPTGVVLRYVDRDRKYKDADEKLDNLLALQVRGEDDRRTLECPHVTRRAQVLALAAQALRQMSNPPASVELTLRRGLDGYFPGDKIKVDVEPEPGGAGIAQLAVVTSRRDDGRNPVKLTVQCDPIAEGAPYTPSFTPDTPTLAEVPGIEHALVLPLYEGGVAIMAVRPALDVIGFRVFFDTDNMGTFAELGTQPGYAVRCNLDVGVDALETTLRLTLQEGEDGPDAYLAGRTAGTEVEAALDVLLAVVANVVDGKVVIGSDGYPEIEFCSVVSRAAVDPDTYDYTVLRGRRNLLPRAWATDSVVWLIPGVSLIAWSHPYMSDLIRTSNEGLLRLSAYTAYAETEETLADFAFLFPGAYYIPSVVAWTTPATSPAALATTGEITPDADITDADGNLVRVQLFSRALGILTPWLDCAMVPTMATTLQDCFTLAGIPGLIDLGVQGTDDRAFELVLIATDSTGNIVESITTLILAGTAGIGLSGVEFAFSNHQGFVTVTLTVASPATQIHYKVVYQGQPAPVAGYTTHVGLSATTAGGVTFAIWARASNGSNHAEWQYRRLSGA